MQPTKTRNEIVLGECSSEPIHLAGTVQPGGILVGLDGTSIAMISSNAEWLFKLPAPSLLGRRIGDLLGAGAEIQIITISQHDDSCQGNTTVIDVRTASGDVRVAAFIYKVGGLVIVEFEKHQFELEKYLPRLYSSMRHYHLNKQPHAKLTQYLNTVCKVLQSSTNYDRVLVYRFDNDMAGDVVAESNSGRLPPLRGHHFSASDIPTQARALYLKNTVRVIGDTSAPPIAIIPELNPLTRYPLDLTFSRIRSVSPAHIEYLRVMGVRSSASSSLIVNGILWGLIAFHSVEPRDVNLELCDALDVIARAVSTNVHQAVTEESREYAEQVRITQETLSSALRSCCSFDTLVHSMGLSVLSLTGSSGVVISRQKSLCSAGKVPEESQINSLISWLRAKVSDDNIFISDALIDVYPEASHFLESGAGIIAVVLDDDLADTIIWFRIEYPRIILWAGEPPQTIGSGVAQPYTMSRSSDSTWEQRLVGHSLPWTKHDCDSAILFAHTLSASFAIEKMQSSELRYQLLVERLLQDKAAAEASNFAVHNERSKAEQAKVSSTIMNSVADSIVTVGSEGRILNANHALYRMFGYSSSEMINKSLNEILPHINIRFPHDNTSNSADVWDLSARYKGEFTTTETVGRHKSGAEFTVELSARDTTALDDMITVVVIRDITERKAFDHILLMKNEHLVAALNELNETQAQLIHSAKMAGLGQIVAGVAHEINNPLGFVIGNLEAISELIDGIAPFGDGLGYSDVKSDRHPTMADRIQRTLADIQETIPACLRGMKRISDITKQLRVFARGANSGAQNEDIVGLINGVLSLVRRQLIDMRIDTIIDMPVTLSLYCFAGELNQVFMNIITNAIHAMPKGGSLTIAAHQRSDGMVEIIFKDTGCGISDDVITKIFEPFFTTKPIGAGSGLGLAISYKIITELHQGMINVNSTPGQGAIFTISLPLHLKEGEKIWTPVIRDC